MLEYDNDFHIMDITCDHCEAEDSTEGQFMDCVDYFKDEGWRFYKDAKDYAHKCPTCIELEVDEG